MFLMGQESWPPSEPFLQEYSNSECLSSIPEKDPYPYCDDSEGIALSVEGSSVHVVHRSATYNCCPDDIQVSLSVEGNVLYLWEEEILTTPCDCMCCYDVESTVAGLSPGMYFVEYCWTDYESGGMACFLGEVEI